MTAAAAVTLAKDVGAKVRAGHPWIYRGALAAGPTPPRGALVDVRSAAGVLIARGFYDPDGPIAVRLLSRGEPVDAPFVARAFRRALVLRQAARERLDSDGVRLIHGEGDMAPGLVIDHYAGVGVVRFDGEAAAAMWRPHLGLFLEEAAAAGYPLRALWARPQGRGAGGGAWLHGRADGVVFREGGARYEVDVVHGQKTGFFLDQRENRRLVGGLCSGARVLNLFAYTGGFSVAAGLGGARAVTTVDAAVPAMAAAGRNLERNGLPPGELVIDDCRRFLERARAERREWDVVVCDPPSFAPSERALPAALVAYRELNRAAAEVVAPGGLLGTASCSSHVTPAVFQETVAAALEGRPRARLLDVRGAGPDHPVLPGFPEGRYLKFLLLAL